MIRRGTGSVVTRRRAQMVLLSAQGMPATRIAEVTFTNDDRVRNVIHDFDADGFDSLHRPLPVMRTRLVSGGSDECRCGSGEVGGDIAPGALDVFLLLADRGDVVQRAFGGVVALKARDDPGG